MNLNLKCAIVIGPSQVNMCLLRKKGKDFFIESLAYYDYKNEQEIDGIINNIADNLTDEVLTNVSLKHQSMIENTYFYNTKTNVRSSIYKDLKRDYEIELKDYIIDYEDNNYEDKKAVYTVAIPKAVVNFYYDIFAKHKKFKLYSFETHGVSLKRIVSEFSEGEHILGCAMFDDYSAISAYKNSGILAFRNLRYSWQELLNSLSVSGGISKEEAEKLLQEKGFAIDGEENEEDKLVYQSIADVFDSFTIEIQRTIDYITSVQKIGKIDKIITIGKINEINKLDKYISRLFSLEAEEFEPQKLIEFSDDVDFSIVKNMNYFEISAGAALREVE